MITDLNRAGIAFGAGAGFVAGIVMALLAGGADAPTGLLVAIQLLAFVIAGLVAGRSFRRAAPRRRTRLGDA